MQRYHFFFIYYILPLKKIYTTFPPPFHPLFAPTLPPPSSDLPPTSLRAHSPLPDLPSPPRTPNSHLTPT